MASLLPYILLAVILVPIFVLMSKNKSKWGINLKRVYCPVCGTKQPIVRIPDSGSQFLWGGTTCPKCGAHLDKFGNQVP